jgi:hypothetical protein
METDKIVRSHILSLLQGGNAHVKFDKAVKYFPLGEINTVFPNLPYSPWQLLEHIRITEWDILDFIRNKNYKWIKWPEDYWPSKSKKATEKDWKNSIAMFNRDSKELERIVKNPKTDLYAKIPHGKGQTILREMLVVADHNAYHLGELVIMRRAMKIWD